MSEEATTLIDEWRAIVMENQDLKTENRYLRERVQELTAAAEAEDRKQQKDTLTPALQNLMNIYEDGYHICNISYGQRRENNEQCMFCLEILQWKPAKKK
ncbi:MAG: DNA replication initiation control protein YabA [Aerococcus sp.]|nr:DNA replication initiation control protein YabA [Aerococcus sp.]